MKKRMKKLLALALAAVMCLSMGLSALADVVTETATNEDGTITVIVTTTETITDPETGEVTVKVTMEETTTSPDGAAVEVEGKETHHETHYYDAEGNGLRYAWDKAGSETKEWTEEPPVDADLPEVKVDLVPGATTEGRAESEPVTKTTGDEPAGADDRKYDYTELATIIDREVEVTMSEQETTAESSGSMLTPVAPDAYDGKEDIKYVDAGYDAEDLAKVEKPDGYDYQLIGYGDYSKHNVVAVVAVHYDKDEQGNTKLDENGKPIITHLTNYYGNTLKVDGLVTTDIKADFDGNLPMPTAAQLVLQDAEGNLIYTYCLDVETAEQISAWYTVSDLEESNYYASKDAEEHIRAIVTNGYWGTANDVDEDQHYQTGSLGKIKQDLLHAIENGEIENTVVEVKEEADGSQTVVYLKDIIGDLTEGEAMDMTQAAIWTYSNGAADVLNGKDGMVIGDPSYGVSDAAAKARMDALYQWLVGLKTEETATAVINESNGVESMSLIVKDKVADDEKNLDEDEENDVYHADIDFTLAFVPGENDELYVYLMDEKNEPVLDNDGNPIVRLLGNENTGDTIAPDDDGVYTLKGLTLGENEDVTFDLKIEGTQYLKKGVYLYKAHGGREASQTLVGIAEGQQEVSVSNAFTVSFSVDEEQTVVAEHYWADEGNWVETYEPSEEEEEPPVEEIPPEDPSKEDAPPVNEPEAPAVSPEEELPPEEPSKVVPSLADAPRTGDNTAVWLVLAIFSALGLAVVSAAEKKKYMSK